MTNVPKSGRLNISSSFRYTAVVYSLCLTNSEHRAKLIQFIFIISVLREHLKSSNIKMLNIPIEFNSTNFKLSSNTQYLFK